MERGENVVVMGQMERSENIVVMGQMEWGENIVVMGQIEWGENIAVIHDKTNRTQDNHIIKKRTPCNSTGGDYTVCSKSKVL
jgi:hypothetical protein